MKQPSEAWYESLRVHLLEDIEYRQPTNGSDSVFSVAGYMARSLGGNVKYATRMVEAEADTQIESMLEQKLIATDSNNQLSLTQAGKDFLKRATA